MAEIVVVYWRDIPAQVLSGRGRRAIKLPLSERFEQAIDRAAMASGAAGTDAYLAEWRKSEPKNVEGDDEAAVKRTAEEIESEYDQARLLMLIQNGGRELSSS